MKKILLLLATLFLSVGLLFAQQDSPQNNPTQNQPATTQDQNAGANANTNANQAGQLPKTGSELPMLISLGLGSLGAGYVVRRKRK